MLNPQGLKRFIRAVVRNEMQSRPNIAKVIALDGTKADIQIAGSASTLKNIDVSGDPGGIEPGKEYVIQWTNTGSSYTPIVVAPAATQNTEEPQISLGAASEDPFSLGGWTAAEDGVITSSTGATRIHPAGQITLGTGNNVAIMSGSDTSYRYWAGNITASSAPFSVSKLGAIKATSGTVGGWTLGANSLSASSNEAKIDASVPSISLGSATDYFTGTGIWMGKHSSVYKLHIGNPAGNYLKWDGTNLTITGSYSGTMSMGATTANTFIVNDDASGGDVVLELKHSSGSAKMTWDGSIIVFDKPMQGSLSVTDLIPSAGNTYDLGSPSMSWRTIYADSMYGITLKNSEVLAFGGYQYIAKGAGNLGAAMTDVQTTITFVSGNEINAAQYDLVQLRDATNGIEIVQLGTLVSGQQWNCTRNIYSSPSGAKAWGNGTVAVNIGHSTYGNTGTLGADATDVATTINFGTNSIVADDYIEIYSSSSTWEIVQAYGTPSGNVWNVVRGMYSTARNWSSGATWRVVSAMPGRFLMDAVTSSVARMSIIQSVHDNSYSVFEPARFGGLTGWQSAGLTGYGFAIGNYAKNKYLYYNSTTSKLVLRGEIYADTGTLVKLDVTGALTVGTGGSIGSGATAYNTGTGWWLEYNGGNPRFFIGNSGGDKMLWSGSALSITGSLTAGVVTIDSSNGLRIAKSTNNYSYEDIRFMDGATTMGQIAADLSSNAAKIFLKTTQPTSTKDAFMQFIVNNTGGSKTSQIDLSTAISGGAVGSFGLLVDGVNVIYASSSMMSIYPYDTRLGVNTSSPYTGSLGFYASSTKKADIVSGTSNSLAIKAYSYSSTEISYVDIGATSNSATYSSYSRVRVRDNAGNNLGYYEFYVDNIKVMSMTSSGFEMWAGTTKVISATSGGVSHPAGHT